MKRFCKRNSISTRGLAFLLGVNIGSVLGNDEPIYQIILYDLNQKELDLLRKCVKNENDL